MQNKFLNIQKTIENLDLNNSNYEVVSGEYFVHLFEPSITFNMNKIYLNSACIKNLPSVEYMQILINPTEQKLVVRPCSEEEKDSFRWCTIKRKPKHISCRIFFCKIMELMNWNCNYRYRILGKLIRCNDELLFLFDLKTPEIFVRTTNEKGEEKISNVPMYPKEWQKQFGIPVDEHKKQLQINLFKGYTVFGIKEHTTK